MQKTSVQTAISVKNLSKVFHVYSKPIDALLELFCREPRHHNFTALENISLEVFPGEIVGIVGRNGAGKSTLLRIISGTLDASAGSVDISGRIASILELGTGFHGEYTGRENIIMGGLCLGMSREEIESKSDSIIRFSELQGVIDQPFKTYSSGMQARLTFSTAISVDPEILVIDEALSVGDASFQRKCLAKIEELRQSHKTVLFVTHSMDAVTSFCTKAILLERGRIIANGNTREVVDKYHELLFGEPEKTNQPDCIETDAVQINQTEDHWTQKAGVPTIPTDNHTLKEKALAYLEASPPAQASCETRYGDGTAEIIHFGILDDQQRLVTRLESGRKYKFFFHVLFYQTVEDPAVGFVVRDKLGTDIFGTSSTIDQQNIRIPTKHRGDLLYVELDVSMWLTSHEYFLCFAVAHPDEKKCDMRFDALPFRVSLTPKIFTTSHVNLCPSMAVAQP